jgi:DNA-binding response OmpR family regulator
MDSCVRRSAAWPWSGSLASVDDVGRILILEPDPEIRELLRRVVTRLGHDALAPAAVPARVPGGLRAIVLEPYWVPALELARTLRKRDRELPLVFESLEPTSPASGELRPLRYLVKPFGLRELEESIEAVAP